MNNAHRFTPSSLLERFVGRTSRDMAKELAAQHNFTISPDELEAFVLREKLSVMKALSVDLKPTVGANAALAHTASAGYSMAVVTSSAKDRVWLCLTSVDQSCFFPEELVFSAASSLPIPVGKPAPDIYLFAMDKMNKRGATCVAIEDSSSGVRSALAAGIKYVVGYVGCYEGHEIEEKAALLRSLGATHIMYDWSEYAQILTQLEGIDTVLFDYDNTLGLTEVVAFAACCQVINELLEEKGVIEVCLAA